jgi:hypothetical protein
MLIFVKPDYLVVFDDLESAKGPVEFDSLLHALGTNSISVSGNTVTIAQNTAKLSGTILSPQDFRYSIQAGQPVAMDGADKPTSYIKIYPSTNSGQAQFLSVLYPRKAGDTVFPVSLIDGITVTGAQVNRNGIYDSVLIRTGDAGFLVGDIVSDGEITFIRKTSTKIMDIALVDGRTLTLQGYQYYGSDSLSSAVLRYSTDTIDGHIQSTVPMTVRIHAAEVPTSVVVNGAALPASGYAYDPDSRVLILQVTSGENSIQVGQK